jgi:branched-chain amino acid transport system ATP-binding protein
VTAPAAEAVPADGGREPPLLSLRGVGKRFGGVVAVADVTLDVPAGQLLGVIGPNGAGKSTLLSLVSGAQRPTSGEILYKGRHRLDRKRSYQIARLGVSRAHQVPRPFGRMSVRENMLVAAHAVVRPARRPESVRELLELCRLEGKAERPAGTLTLLDLKRLEVARALALDPELLLLDEVAAGLVGTEIDEITQLIERIHRSGTTVILVEHVQALVQALAQRVVVLDWGRVIAEGGAEEIAVDPEVIRVYLGTSGAEPDSDRPARPRQERPAVLRVEEVSVDYGKLRALRSASLEIFEGEIVAVLGANGAGKSSLARGIAGVVPTSSGRIVVDGVDATRLPAHQRARLGVALCHEGRRVFTELTVRENLDLAAAYSRRGSVRRDERLERVYGLFPLLKERARALAGDLSGGQQQMVAIARALMAEPRVLIFDELSLGLAPTIVDEIFEMLGELREWGIAMVLIEQNVYRSLGVADRVYVVERGRISFSGSPAELRRNETLQEAYFGTRGRRAAGTAAQPEGGNNA